MRYKGGNNKTRQLKLKQTFKNRQSSDCWLKLANMKSESLVIVNHHVTVNDLSNFAHTAHHARRVVLAGHYLFFLKRVCNHVHIQLVFYLRFIVDIIMCLLTTLRHVITKL